MNGAASKTSAAPDAGTGAEIFNEIIEFVHYSLSHSFFSGWSGIMAGSLDCEIAKHTTVPVSYSAAVAVCRFVNYIEAMARWAKICTNTAAETFFVEFIPYWAVD